MNETFNELRLFISEFLGVDCDNLGLNDSVFQLGIDSIMMITFVKELNQHFETEMSLSELNIQYNTLKLISDYIEMNRVSKFEKKYSSSNDDKIENELIESDNAYYELCENQRKTMEKIFLHQLSFFKELSRKSHNKRLSSKIDGEKNHASEVLASNYDIVNELTDMNKAYIIKLINSLNSKTKKSKQLSNDNRQYLADLDEIAGFDLTLKELHYLITIDHGLGCHIFDIDDNEYIDIAMGYGTLLFGHSPEIITRSLHNEVNRGIQLGARHRLVGDVAKNICLLTKFDRVTFTTTGTEAVMTAMKLMRAYTRKKKIGVFTGCYHGHNDTTLLNKFTKNGKPRAIASGISEAAQDDIVLLDFDDLSVVPVIENLKDDLAGIIIEPVQSRRPGHQPVEFLKKLREVTSDNGILMAFDEVITGFRCNSGGAKALFNIDVDLAIYGKALCNGMPAGVIAGKQEIMNAADGGLWQFGDNSFPKFEHTYYAGTFFKHPLALTAASEILKFFIKDSNVLQNTLSEKTAEMAEKINLIFNEYKVPMEVTYFSSLFKFESINNSVYMDVFYYTLLDKGIYTWEGRTCFLSAVHTDDDIKKIIEAVKETVREMSDAGFFIDDTRTVDFLDGIPDSVFYD